MFPDRGTLRDTGTPSTGRQTTGVRSPPNRGRLPHRRRVSSGSTRRTAAEDREHQDPRSTGGPESLRPPPTRVSAVNTTHLSGPGWGGRSGGESSGLNGLANRSTVSNGTVIRAPHRALSHRRALSMPVHDSVWSGRPRPQSMPVQDSVATPVRTPSGAIDACPGFGGNPRQNAVRGDRCLSTIDWTPSGAIDACPQLSRPRLSPRSTGHSPGSRRPTPPPPRPPR
jgi:hypothetical protein